MVNKVKRVVIVEPHFDDAWLNLGGFILKNKQYKYKIVTLSDHPSNSVNGMKKISELLKMEIDLVFLGYKSLGFDDPTILEMEKKYNTKKHSEIFLKMNKLINFDKIKNEIKKAAGNFDMLFWPLGMKHPQHILMDDVNPFDSYYLYREYPYFFYNDQEKILLEKTKNLKKKKISIDEVFDIKKKMFILAYPKQKFILDLLIDGKNYEDVRDEIFWTKGKCTGL